MAKSNSKIQKVSSPEKYKSINLKAIDDDSQLSWKAKGILVYLLSRPNNWTFNRTDIINRSTEGRTAVGNGLDELKENGYLEIKDNRDTEGKFDGYVWIITDDPKRKPIKPETRETRNSDNGNFGKPTTNNKNSNNKNNNNKEEYNNIDGSEEKEKLQEIYDHWNEKESTITHRKFKQDFKKHMKARLKDFTLEEIKLAITNYDKVVRADNTYFEYDAWSLGKFLKRGAGDNVERFIEKPKTFIEDGSDEFKFEKGDDKGWGTVS